MKYTKIISGICFIFITNLLHAANPAFFKSLSRPGDWRFIENKGQISSNDIRFYSHKEGIYILCKPGEISFVFTKYENPENDVSEALGHPVETQEMRLIHASSKVNLPGDVFNASLHKKTTISRTDLVLLNANLQAPIVGEDRQPYYENYYTHGHADKGIEVVSSFNTIIYIDVYSHIDLVLNIGKEKNLEYSFVVHPGGNAADIKLQWTGLTKKELIRSGGYLYANALGKINESKPQTFSDGVLVPSKFYTNEGYHGFAVKDYDKSKDLIIDPMLSWFTYYEPKAVDYSTSVRTDDSGHVYVAGWNYFDYALVKNSTYPYNTDTPSSFIAKFNTSGKLLWTTYFGINSGGYSGGVGLCVDDSGNEYACGSISNDSSLATKGAYQTKLEGDGGAYLARFNSSGKLIWATYYGGKGGAEAISVATDKAGNVFMAGATSSDSGIATSGGYKTSFSGPVYLSGSGTYATFTDAFLAKFSRAGKLLWGTYYGGSHEDVATCVTTDNSGGVFITGNTGSNGLATSGSYISATLNNTYIGTAFNAFLAKFNESGTMAWSTYLEKDGGMTGNAISSDNSGNIFVTGYVGTQYPADSFIASPGAYLRNYNQYNSTAYLEKFSSSGGHIWGSFFGGSGGSSAQSLSVDSSGNIYLLGSTTSHDGIATSGTYQTSYQAEGNASGFLAKWSNTGNRSACTYFGGNNPISPNSVCADHYGNVFVTGTILDSSNIATSGAYQTSYSGGSDDGFLAKFRFNRFPDDAGIDTNDPYNTLCAGEDSVKVVLQNYGYNILGSVKINWSLNDTLQTPFTWSGELEPSYATVVSIGLARLAPGTYKIKAWTSKPNTHIDSLPGNDTAIIYFKVNPLPPYFLGKDTGICYGTSIKLGIDTGNNYYVWTENPNPYFDSWGSYPYAYVSPDRNTVYTLTQIMRGTGCRRTDSIRITVNPVPVPALTVNNSGECLTGNQFSFTDKSTISAGKIAAWKWNFGDNDSTTTQNPTYSYSKVGTYTVKLTITTDKGCAKSKTTSVYVYPEPKAIIGVNNSTGCLANNSFTFYDNSTISVGKINTEYWDFGDTSISESRSPSHSYSNPGYRKVKLLVTSDIGCTDTTSTRILVYPSPFAYFEYNQAGQCLSSNKFSFTDKSSAGSAAIVSWNWDFGDGTSTSQNPSHSFTYAGNHTVKLTITDKNGCTSNYQSSLTVFPQPKASDILTKANECLIGNSFSFTDYSTIASGKIISWHRDFGDKNSSAAQNATHSYSTPGTYNATLIVTSDSGCVDSATNTINVYPQPKASFLIDDSQQCGSNNIFNFTDKSTVSSGTISSWAWDFGNGSQSTSQSPSNSYIYDGKYVVRLLVITDKGCGDSMGKNANVYPQPTARFVVNNSSQCEQGNKFVLSDKSILYNDTISTWQWRFGDGNSSAKQNPVYTYKTSGTDTIKLLVISKSGCKDSTAQTMIVKASPDPLKNTASAICNGDSVILGTKPISGDSYTWYSFSGNFSSRLSNPVVKPLASTVYILNESIASTGCSTIDTVRITVHSLPAADFSAKSFCLGDSTVFTNKTDSASSYIWNFGDGQSAVKTNPVHLFKKQNTYNVSLKATNNSGCSDSVSESVFISSCVWPGDANNDKTVNMIDFLAVGIAYGTAGHLRPNASLAWVEQPSPDWDSLFANGVNYKHADCNGDSLVDYHDTIAISKNYGKSHKKSSLLNQGNPSDPPFVIQSSNDTLYAGDTLKALIHMGTASNPVQSLYGLSFSIFFDPTIFDISKAELKANTSFFGTYNLNLMTMKINDSASSAIDFGITRTDHINASGYGDVAMLYLPVKLKLTQKYLKTALEISNNTQISYNLANVPLYFTSDSMEVAQHRSGINEKGPNNMPELKLFPNPFSDAITLQYSLLKPSNITVALFDITGKQMGMVAEDKQSAGQYSLNIKAEKYHLYPGVYLLKFMTDDGYVSRRIVKF